MNQASARDRRSTPRVRGPRRAAEIPRRRISPRLLRGRSSPGRAGTALRPSPTSMATTSNGHASGLFLLFRQARCVAHEADSARLYWENKLASVAPKHRRHPGRRERFPRRALSMPAKLGRAGVSETHLLQQARQRRTLRRLRTAGAFHHRAASRTQVAPLVVAGSAASVDWEKHGAHDCANVRWQEEKRPSLSSVNANKAREIYPCVRHQLRSRQSGSAPASERRRDGNCRGGRGGPLSCVSGAGGHVGNE